MPSSPARTWTAEWFGTTTFRARGAGRTLFFDGYLDRLPGLPPVGLRPDVAFLALGGRPNVSGEPYQGSSARFMLEQGETLSPARVCFCHHDPVLPGFPGTDVTAAAALLEARHPGSYFTLDYAAPRPLFP